MAEATRVDDDAVEAGKITMIYEEGEWLNIEPFSDDEAGKDASGAFLIMCHLVKSGKGEKKVLQATDGTPILNEKGESIKVMAIRKGALYQAIRDFAGIDVTPFKGANALEQGLYRISMPHHAMNDHATGKNTFAKGGIYFSRSQHVGWKVGYIFTRPGYDRSGFYTKNAPTPDILKQVCERMVGRLNGTTKKTKVKLETVHEE